MSIYTLLLIYIIAAIAIAIVILYYEIVARFSSRRRLSKFADSFSKMRDELQEAERNKKERRLPRSVLLARLNRVAFPLTAYTDGKREESDELTMMMLELRGLLPRDQENRVSKS